MGTFPVPQLSHAWPKKKKEKNYPQGYFLGKILCVKDVIKAYKAAPIQFSSQEGKGNFSQRDRYAFAVTAELLKKKKKNLTRVVFSWQPPSYSETRPFFSSSSPGGGPQSLLLVFL